MMYHLCVCASPCVCASVCVHVQGGGEGVLRPVIRKNESGLGTLTQVQRFMIRPASLPSSSHPTLPWEYKEDYISCRQFKMLWVKG
jgi:hypothetical protein